MTTFTQSDIERLVEFNGSPCVSIFMPAHRVSAHTEEDRLRLKGKGLLEQAEERLLEGGLRRPDMRELLEPGWRLHGDSLFWRHQNDGLAIFLAPQFERHYRLPLPLSELLVVSNRFHLKPLLPLLTGDGQFYVLAISQNGVKLLEGTRLRVAEVDISEVPQSLSHALRHDDLERQLQFHTRSAPREGQREAMYHGHGQAHGEDPKNQLLRYYRQIDGGLRDFLGDKRIPLVLAGVEYYLPIYRQANTHPWLVDEIVTGSPDRVSAEELHQSAWAIVEPLFRRDRELAANLLRQAAGHGQASTDLKEILPAAAQGRVECAFVAVGRQEWGAFDATQQSVEVHDPPQANDHDLLDAAAVETLAKGGQVYAVDPDDMPLPRTSVAAFFRF